MPGHRKHFNKTPRRNGSEGDKTCASYKDAVTEEEVILGLRMRRERAAREKKDMDEAEQKVSERKKITLPTLKFMGDASSTGLDILAQTDGETDE